MRWAKTVRVAAVSRETLDRLEAYRAMVLAETAHQNLIARSTFDVFWARHIVDSAQLLTHIEGAGDGPWLDLGAGAGLPGIVLAVCRPELDVRCVDTVGKKAAFIQQVAASLKLPNLQGVHARVETLAGPFDVICCRAFAALPDFVRWSRQALAPDGVWMAMKGKLPQAEIDALPADVQVFHVEPLQVPGLDAERCMVWLRPRP